MIEEELDNKELFEIPVEGLSFANDIGIIYDKNYLTSAANRFIEML